MGADAKLLGGGTDLQLLRRQGVIAPKRLIALARVAELQGVRTLPDGGIEIGAAVTLSALAEAMRDRVPKIAEAVERIATPQIRELATVGGNLIQAKRCWFYRSGFGCYKRLGGLAPCYAVEGDHRFYHAAIDGHRCQATTPSDLATVFVAFGATAVITGPEGERDVPMEDFYIGPGETVLADDDILRAIRLPADAAQRLGYFRKIRLWEGDFAVVSIALTTRVAADGAWQNPRIVFGGLAPTPWRAVRTEHRFDGRPATLAALRTCIDNEFDRAAHPLARNGWKLDAAAGLVEHAFEAIERARADAANVGKGG